MPAQPFVGQIMWTPFGFPPVGWAFCDGSLVAISQNPVLFNLIGTTYGGDGALTFALPDLRGRTPIAAGQGPGLGNYTPGQRGGVEAVALTVDQIPPHGHTARCSSSRGNTTTPSGAAVWAASSGGDRIYSTGRPDTTLAEAAVEPTGGNQAHENLPPLLAINYCIALTGIFPSRNAPANQAVRAQTRHHLRGK